MKWPNDIAGRIVVSLVASNRPGRFARTGDEETQMFYFIRNQVGEFKYLVTATRSTNAKLNLINVKVYPQSIMRAHPVSHGH